MAFDAVNNILTKGFTTNGVNPFQFDFSGSNLNLAERVSQILQVIIGLAGPILIIMIMISGIRWMVSGGSDEKVAAAKSMLLNAIVGFILLVSAFAIGTYVINVLK